ncbi:MAG: stage III sporulation protein AB [Firmicutes bacterium]|nr:stage III sporulation protein AB [Bacillota bacterium]
MVKILGAVMTGAACGCFGFKLSLSMKTRVKSLADIAASLEMLESEISFSVNKLKKAFARADRNGLFTSAADNMEENGIDRAWTEAVDKNKSRLCLTSADSDILLMLGKNIGRTDAEDQIKNIKYIKAMVKEREKQAQSDYDRFGKLYRSGGVLIGLMIIIILI